MTDGCDPWFNPDQSDPNKVTVFAKLRNGIIARFEVPADKHSDAIWWVSKEVEARPVLALIQGG